MNKVYMTELEDVMNKEINRYGKYLETVKRKLEENISSEGVIHIVDNSAKLLQYCPNPDDKSTQKETGIVIGKVQSGKTSNFLSTIAMAFDNGYNIAIVLGGTKKDLVYQNTMRIKDYFSSVDEEVYVLDSINDQAILVSKEIKRFINRNKKIIIVSLKHKNNISSLKDALFQDKVLAQEPVLIIDDEGDEASLNGAVKKNKMTATYKAIFELKEILNRHAFISVTATPQTNVLIKGIDVLSPSFGILTPPGKGYCGLDMFHRPNSKYIIEIPEEEPDIFEQGIPQSLYDALLIFFCGGAIRTLKKNKVVKHAMLIHPSYKKDDHVEVELKVNQLLESWIKHIRHFKQSGEDIVIQELQDKCSEILNNELQEASQELDEEAVIKEVFNAIQDHGLHVMNSDRKGEVPDSYYDYNIYIGGDILGRGLTIEGLSVTYLVRTAKGISNVNTVLQRARWFGYKTDYIDVCRVYLPPKIKNQFMNIREHENEMWQIIGDADLEGIRFKEIPRVFSLKDTSLRISDKSKTDYFEFNYPEWNRQNQFIYDKTLVQENQKFIQEFFDNYESMTDIYSPTEKSMKYKRVLNISFQKVWKDLLLKLHYPPNSRVNKASLLNIRSLITNKKLNIDCDVILMRFNDVSVYSVDNGYLPNYFQGRTESYKGDNKHFNDDSKITVQIHEITDRITNVESYVVAYRIPPIVRHKLIGMVVRNDEY